MDSNFSVSYSFDKYLSHIRTHIRAGIRYVGTLYFFNIQEYLWVPAGIHKMKNLIFNNKF